MYVGSAGHLELWCTGWESDMTVSRWCGLWTPICTRFAVWPAASAADGAVACACDRIRGLTLSAQIPLGNVGHRRVSTVSDTPPVPAPSRIFRDYLHSPTLNIKHHSRYNKLATLFCMVIKLDEMKNYLRVDLHVRLSCDQNFLMTLILTRDLFGS